MADNDRKFALRRIFLQHVGRENAIKLDAILIILGAQDERHVRRAIENLIEDDGFPVCSITDEEPKGYFFPATVEEASECKDKWQEQARAIMHRGTHLEEITARWHEKARQLDMV